MRKARFGSLTSVALVGASVLVSDDAHAGYDLFQYLTGSRVYYVTGAKALGGVAEEFLADIESFQRDGTQVVLRHHCASACTLYTALLRRRQLCAKSGTTLYFHQYVFVDRIRRSVGGYLTSTHLVRIANKQEFARIWRAYPRSIRRAIRKAGGLPPIDQPMLAIKADALGIPVC